MLRAFDGFGHWQPGGVGITLPTTDGATSAASDSGLQLNHFWTGKGGTVATAGGELDLSSSNSYLFMNLDAQHAWVVGFRFKQATLYSGWGAGLLRIRDCAAFTDLGVLAVESTGHLSLYAGNQETLLATTASAVIAANTYYDLEFKVFADGATWSMEVHLDGIPVPGLAVSGTGTLASLVPDAYGAASMNQIMLAGVRKFKHFYALDGQGADGLTGFLGPCVVEHWVPSEDSETGTMTFAAGSPPNTGTYGFTAWDVNSAPGSVGTGVAGNALAAVVGTQYATGDAGYIGTSKTTSGGNPDLVLAGFAPLASLSGGGVRGVAPFAVCKTAGPLTLDFGSHVSEPLTPFYGHDGNNGQYQTSDAGWNLNYTPGLPAGNGASWSEILHADGDGRPWDDATLGSARWHLSGITGTPGSIKVAQFGLLVLRTLGTPWPVAAATRYALAASAGAGPPAHTDYAFGVECLAFVEQHYFPVEAYSDYALVAALALHDDHLFSRSAISGYAFSADSSSFREIPASAASSHAWTPNATGGRDIPVFASTGYGVDVGDTGRNPNLYVAALASYAMEASASASASGPHAPAAYLMAAGAFASLFSPAEQDVPQTTDLAAGPQVVLYSGLSRDFPLCFVEASNGTVLAANGIDPMLRWDGFASYAEKAGVPAPVEPLIGAGYGAGLLVGKRYAIQRFFDRHGNTSNPGPVSAPILLGDSGVVTGADVDASGITTLTSRHHGLASGDVVTVGGLVGIPAAGSFAIVAVDRDRYTLLGFVAAPGSALLNAGWWVRGSARVDYHAPAPTDPKVVRRQILRTLDGDATVFYADVDTTDVSGTAFSSAADDQELSGHEAVPFAFDDQMPAAYRYGVPPSHKSALAYHLGRVFAAVDRPYSRGTAEVRLGSPVVRGAGVEWPASFAGRLLVVDGASREYAISEAREGGYLILDRPYADPSDPFAAYAIRPSDIERRLVYYSEPNSAESWPAWNAFSVPEHSDELTGLLVLNSFLYLVEERHVSSFTFKSDPGRDGFTFLKSHRGCVNHRCLAVVEDVVYMLDEAGIHRFDGENSEHVSSKVHNLFNDPTYPYRVDWAADRTLWHACVDPVNEVIRWFVDFVAREPLTHAICHDYRRDRSWLESYGEPITASAPATLGHRRVLAGTTARRVVVLDEGVLDGLAEDASLAGGVVWESTPTTLSIDATKAAPLPASLPGVQVVITSGAAKGQRSTVAASDEWTIEVVKPFPTQPMPGDSFQLGGIPFAWQGTWLPSVDREESNARDLAVVFRPTASPGGFDLRTYHDHSDEPRAWATTRDLDGVSTLEGSPDISVDTRRVRGYAIQHLSGRRASGQVATDYFTKVEIAGVQGVDPVRIFQVIVSGVSWQGGGQEALDVRGSRP